MLTPAPAARSFSESLPGRAPATTEESACAPPAQRPEALDQASYFDTIMRLRSRRPIGRCRRPSH